MTHHIPEEAVAFQGEGSLVISDSNRLVLAEYLQLSCVLILHARFPALYVGLALDGLFTSQKCFDFGGMARSFADIGGSRSGQRGPIT